VQALLLYSLNITTLVGVPFAAGAPMEIASIQIVYSMTALRPTPIAAWGRFTQPTAVDLSGTSPLLTALVDCGVGGESPLLLLCLVPLFAPDSFAIRCSVQLLSGALICRERLLDDGPVL
jgi:hypothetical protein